MIKPRSEILTKSLIESINPKEIIYAEVAYPGAMGNAGGISLYLIKEDVLMCYETNVFWYKEIYVEAVELLLKHQNQFRNIDIELQDELFDVFNGGMGNYVFVNINIILEIKERFFIYRKDNIDYQILPSVDGVFDSVVYTMKNPKSDERFGTLAASLVKDLLNF